MAKGDASPCADPSFVEEHTLAGLVPVDNVREKDIDDSVESGSNSRVNTSPSQRGIRFHDMQMRIHRLLFVFVNFTQALIIRQSPVALERFKIALVVRVAAAAFQQIEDRRGFL